jgi:hypothetical protein
VTQRAIRNKRQREEEMFEQNESIVKIICVEIQHFAFNVNHCHLEEYVDTGAIEVRARLWAYSEDNALLWKALLFSTVTSW